jgi:glutamate N-acetyltransferase/amino-acid N-acetyltransferase
VQRPENVTEVAGGTLPKGFRAAGVACGIKQSGDRDLGMIVSDAPGTTSAARFSRSGAQSAPVLVSREHSRLDALRAVVVNSGNANAATGRRGYDDAAKMQGSAAIVAGVSEDQVAVASTGVIGVPLPSQLITNGLPRLAAELRPDGADDFAEAIRTTDAFPKQVTMDVALEAGTVRVSVQAKGAGMISPNFATLLVFVQTDAAMDSDEAALLLSVCTQRSFDRISVDGQLSTSDTIVLQASGASGVVIEPRSADERAFGEALDAALRQIALLVARDGEGARRVGRIIVRGGDERGVPRVARAIADISIEGVVVCVNGSYVKHDARALAEAVKRDEVEYEVVLPGEGVEAERYFSDLGHEYITINADYTT